MDDTNSPLFQSFESLSVQDLVQYPNSRLKVDEFFLLWLSSPETQLYLRREFQLEATYGNINENLYEDIFENEKTTQQQEQLEDDDRVNGLSPPLVILPMSPKSKSRPLLDIMITEPVQPDKPSTTPVLLNEIPQFYFPFGKPLGKLEERKKRHSILNSVRDFFVHDLNEEEMIPVTKKCGLARFVNSSFCKKMQNSRGLVSFSSFSREWKELHQQYHDQESMIYGVLRKKNNNYLVWDDFVDTLRDVVITHPGLEFLNSLPVFQERYIETVISRIFYAANKHWDSTISLVEFRKTGFVKTLFQLEETEDTNQCREFFSYKHFYVIYCKFWELDNDHDMKVDRDAMIRYNNCALTSKIVDRVISGAGLGRNSDKNYLDYKDFIWFLISEEDKTNPTGIEYWFRCLDTDGDGVISMYELEGFYEEQIERMESMAMDPILFSDCLLQIFDIVKPKKSNVLCLSDLRKCSFSNVVFDMFFNLGKFIAFEQKEPMCFQDPSMNAGLSAWDRFAETEYDQMAMEQDNDESQLSFSSPSDDALNFAQNEGLIVNRRFGSDDHVWEENLTWDTSMSSNKNF